ncbi:hypothetical protein EEB14_54720 [Rhodococcus sp. WS4]|nr:hypothetical protein EEB14_54720 [Rhodococcus sp. WS4]
MPLLIFNAAIACVSLIAPSRLIASIQRILTNAALMRANARWLAMTAIAQQEFSSHHERKANGPSRTTRTIRANR